MADFEYSSKAWSKIKPLAMKKTGLGDALKKYEQKRDALESGGW